MPYPLAKLAYGLRCRLSDLTTPVERYHLQIAAGNPSICPPTPQHIQKNYDHLQFKKKNGTISVVNQVDLPVASWPPVEFGEKDLVGGRTWIALYEFDLEDLSSETFDYFLLRPRKVNLYKCIISNTFLNKLATLTSKNVTSFEASCCSQNSHISCSDIFTAYPNLKSIILYNYHIPKNWVSEIQQFGHSLKYLVFNLPALQFEPIDCDVLLKFIKERREPFLLHIHLFNYNAKLELVKLEPYFLQIKQHMEQQGLTYSENRFRGLTSSRIEFEYRCVYYSWSLPLSKNEEK